MKFQGDKIPGIPPGGTTTTDGRVVQYGSNLYKQLYNEGSIMGVSEDGSPADQLDEVVLKAYNRNNLSEDEKKVYNKFYTGRKSAWGDNPNYDSTKRQSRTNPRRVKSGDPKREFQNTQVVKNGGESFDIDAYGAVKMFKDSGASYSEDPSLPAKIFAPEAIKIGDKKGFRPHASPWNGTIHIDPKRGIDAVIAELAHVFPNIAETSTIKGTYEKTKRFFKEKKMPDKSNYSSKHDFEYKTHSGPNSVENKLLTKYGTKIR